jgi:hypothetical protein
MPTDAFIYSDAMTESIGDTPKEGVERKSKQTKSIKNRLFCVEVICRPIDMMLYVSTDKTMAGGANLAIEIQRLALEYLAKELEKQGLRMPRRLHFQFDNCGENKVTLICKILSLLFDHRTLLFLYTRAKKCSAILLCLFKLDWLMKCI